MPFECYANSFSGNWKNIIEKYAALNSHYLEYASDAAYWYSEMTNTGLLATAAWMCDAPAISEVREQKRIYNNQRGRPGPSTGRVDLFFYPDGSAAHWVETKCLASPVDISERKRRHRVIRGLNRRMGEARQSARQCHQVARAASGAVVSLTFAPFVLCRSYFGPGRRSTARKQRADLATELLAAFAQENECSYAAYFNIDHIDIWDADEKRPFGFGMVAHFQNFSDQ